MSREASSPRLWPAQSWFRISISSFQKEVGGTLPFPFSARVTPNSKLKSYLLKAKTEAVLAGASTLKAKIGFPSLQPHPKMAFLPQRVGVLLTITRNVNIASLIVNSDTTASQATGTHGAQQLVRIITIISLAVSLLSRPMTRLSNKPRLSKTLGKTPFAVYNLFRNEKRT